MRRAASHPVLIFLAFCTSLLAVPITAFSQSPFSSVKMEVTLKQEASGWKVEARFNAGDQEFANPIRDFRVSDNEVGFQVNIGGADVHFVGKHGGDKLGGSLEAFEKNTKIAAGTWSLIRQSEIPSAKGLAGKWSGTFAAQLIGEQRADPNFDTRVVSPAYFKSHPRVLLDEAHNNFHTSTGRYKPFVDLMTHDGYQVLANTERFTKKTLEGYDILVISNALGPKGQRDSAAFTNDECDAVRDWVRAGGALLLIADHAPMGAAAEILSKRFGVEMSKGYTSDQANYDKGSKEMSQLIFSRENGLLAKHSITKGRNASERINRVVTFTGQSLQGPEGSVAILQLGDTAVDRLPGGGKEVSAASRSQGVVLRFGKGKVAVWGEAAMLTAQISGEGEEFGMNVPGSDDRQLALNIMHWLSGLLK